MNQKHFLEQFERNLVMWLEVLDDKDIDFDRDKLREILIWRIKSKLCPAVAFWRLVRVDDHGDEYQLIPFDRAQSFYYLHQCCKDRKGDWQESKFVRKMIAIVERVIQ